MRSKNQLVNTIHLTQNLKGLAQAYEQISVSKMQRARGKVFAARNYLNEISEIFADVKTSYQDETKNILKGKINDKGSITYTTRQKNGKSIAVLLTSNKKLYGDIGRKVFNFFIENIREKNDVDIFIIGKIGLGMYKEKGYVKPYKYMDLPEDENANESLIEILKVLSMHETVTVYYGQFINFLTQTAVESNVSGTQRSLDSLQKKEKKKFLFEPSLDEIMLLFENQIFTLLFKQTLHESELSHVGARITQMENALDNIKQSEKKLNVDRLRILKKEEGRKQLQRLAGRSLWRRI